MQEVSGIFTSTLLEIYELKMALRARKVSGGSRDRPRDAEIDSTLGLEKISNCDHSRNASQRGVYKLTRNYS